MYSFPSPIWVATTKGNWQKSAVRHAVLSSQRQAEAVRYTMAKAPGIAGKQQDYRSVEEKWELQLLNNRIHIQAVL